MDDQTLLILALALLAVAGFTVSITGWILFARGRKADGVDIGEPEAEVSDQDRADPRSSAEEEPS